MLPPSPSQIRGFVSDFKSKSDEHYSKLCAVNDIHYEIDKLKRLDEIVQLMIDDAIKMRMQIQPYLEGDGNNS